MKKETFIKLLESIANIHADVDKLNTLKIDIAESNIVTTFEEVFDTIINDTYGTGGLEWVLWWVYEKSNNPELKAYETNEQGEDIEILHNIDELYEYLEKYHRK